MDRETVASEVAEELVSICRTTVGDELRSVVYFTDDDVESIYLRDDLDRSADLIGFATHERHGFQDQSTYQDTQLGEYQATIRMFENGYLTRVIYGRTGVWVTTGEMSIERFNELVTALKTVLTDLDPATTDQGAK